MPTRPLPRHVVDPETHAELAPASDETLAALTRRLDSGAARRRNGEPIARPLEGAFVAASRRAVYLVEAGVPNFVIDERVELDAEL